MTGRWHHDHLLLNAGDAGEGDGCFAAPQLIESRLLASHLEISFLILTLFRDPDPDPDPDAHRLLESYDLILPLLNGFLLLLPPLIKKLLVPDHQNLS